MSIQTQIAQLQTQADALAAEFKNLFASASASYASGTSAGKAAAKGLAGQGRAIEGQCKALNAQANQLRSQLKQKRQALEPVYDELKEINRQIESLTAQPRRRRRRRGQSPADKIQLKGFHLAKGIDAAFVRQVLREVPVAILAKIENIAFVDEVQRDRALGRTSAERLPDNTVGLARIRLFPTNIELNPQKIQRLYREVILHETGHVLFECILSSKQRVEWGSEYNKQYLLGTFVSKKAQESLREDFAEWLMFYLAHPAHLLKFESKRYTMLDQIMERLEE